MAPASVILLAENGTKRGIRSTSPDHGGTGGHPHIPDDVW